MLHPRTGIGSLSPWWGREEQIESVNVLLMTGTSVKLEKNLIFLENGKNSKIAKMVQGSLKKFLDLR